MRRWALLLFVLSASFVHAQTVSLPKEIRINQGRLVAVKIEYTGDAVSWRVSDGIDCFREYNPDTSCVCLRVLGYRQGRYEIIAIAAKGGKLSPFAVCAVVVSNAPEPQPPGPKPKPEPPTPNPDNPMPGVKGLHVLMVFEQNDIRTYTKGQFAALYGGEVDRYLRAKCAKEPSGTPSRNIWDKDLDATRARNVWRKAFARPRTSLPWIVISNGTSGFEGPLPETLPETMKLLKKYGG